jgi:hypothetical protein
MPVLNAPLPGQSGHHGVQFYNDAHKLCTSVADFLGDGIAAGQPLIVVATPKHRQAIVNELRTRHFDVDGLLRDGEMAMLDAKETLELFMVDGVPDGKRFHDAVGAKIEKVRRGRNDCVIRAYGEMVDLLWRSGNPEGATRLELLWNDLAEKHSFSLLCGYAIGNFYKETQGMQHVCDLHTHNEILRSGNA